MIHFKMTTNTAVNRNLTHVTNNWIIPLNVYEPTKSKVTVI